MSDNNTFLQRIKGLFGRKNASSQTADQPIPNDWLNAAQREAGLLLARDAVEASRQAEADHAIDLVALREAMLNHLDMAALTELAPLVGLAASQLLGGKGRRVLLLLQSAERNNQLPTLLQACRDRQPDVAWQRNNA